MFIQTEVTPNPNSLKFLPGKKVSNSGPYEITNKENIPYAVLIRAIQPRDGIDFILQRRKKKKIDRSLTAGPGSLTRALGITVKYSGILLMDNLIWLEDQNIKINNQDILASPRVGVQYAGKDANNPWRFRIKGNPWTSPAP